MMGTRGKHVNVLQHLMGYLKKHLSGKDKAYRRQVYLWQVGAPGLHRGLPAGAGAASSGVTGWAVASLRGAGIRDL
jgi:hypothetical protein